MVSKLVFPSIFLFFLSWGLLGFSQETQQMDLEKGADTLGQDISGILQQVQQQSAAATAPQGGAGASADAMPCMQKLMPCQPFMHSPSPPATCCSPLKKLITQESQCLCKVFDNPELLKTFNLTKDEALAIPKACGIEVDISVCKNATSPSASPTNPSTPSKPGSSSINSSDLSNASSNSSNSSNSSGSSNSNASVRINDAIVGLWFIASVSVVMFSALYI